MTKAQPSSNIAAKPSGNVSTQRHHLTLSQHCMNVSSNMTKPQPSGNVSKKRPGDVYRTDNCDIAATFGISENVT
jgi:hypothetical protein